MGVISWLLTAHDGASDAFNSADRSLGRLHKTTQRADGSFRAADGRLRDSRGRYMAFGKDVDGANGAMGRFDKWNSKVLRGLLSMRLMMNLLKFGAIVAAINLVVGGFGALLAAAISLAGALAPLSGLLVAYPAILGAVAQGAGVAKLAFFGIGDAVKAMNKNQTSGAADAQAAAERQVSAARQIRSARESLAEAQRAASDRMVAANNRVEDAEDSLAEAIAGHHQKLADLQNIVERSALTNERAQLRTEQAERRLQEVRNNPDSDPLDIRDAELALAEARQDQSDTLAQSKQQERELQDTKKRGVRGDRDVISAQEDLRDARKGVADAEKENSRDIVKAQRAVAEAVRDAAKANKELGTSASGLNDAMNKLPASGQRFVRFLFSLKPRLLELRNIAADNMLPGVERGIRNALPLLNVLQPEVGATARVLGGLAEQAGRLIGSKGFGQDFATIMGGNRTLLTRLGGVALNLLKAFMDLMVVAQPLVDWMGKLFLGWSEGVAQAAALGRETGTLEAFFERTMRVADQLFRIFGNLWSALKPLFQQGAPEGERMLGTLERLTEKFDGFMNSARGENAIQTFFARAKPVMDEVGKIIADVFKIIVRLGQNTDLAPFLAQLRTTLLPALEKLLALTTGDMGESLVNITTNFVRLGSALLSSGGSLNGFLNSVETLSGFLATLVERAPVLGKIVTGFAGIAALGKATGITPLLSGLGSMIQNQRVLNALKLQGAAATTAEASAERISNLERLKSIALKARDIVVLGAQKVALLAGAVVTGIATAAQWLWNLALSANPIALIIIAIVAVVVLIVRWYKTSERARTIINGVWNSIKSALSVLWGAAKTVFGWFGTAWRNLGALGGWLYDRIAGSFRNIGAVFRWLMNAGAALGNFITGVIRTIVGMITGLVSNMFNFGKTLVSNFIDGLKSLGSGVADTILGLIPGPIKSFLHLSSPAEKGPLSVNGGPEGWGAKLVTTYVDGMLAHRSDVDSAMGRLLSPQLSSLPGTTAVDLAGIVRPGGQVAPGAGPGSGGYVDKSVTVNVESQADAQEIADRVAWEQRTSGR